MAGTCDDHWVQVPGHSVAERSSVTGHWDRLPRQVINAPCLPVPRKKKYLAFDCALHNGIHFLVIPEVVRQLD